MKSEGDLVKIFDYLKGIRTMFSWIVFNVIKPMSFDEASEHEKWRNTMEEEYEYIIGNKT